MSKQENNTNAAKNEVNNKSDESLCELLENILKICKEIDKLSPEEKDRNEWAEYDKDGNQLFKY